MVDPLQDQLVADAGLFADLFAALGRRPRFQQGLGGGQSGLGQLASVHLTNAFDVDDLCHFAPSCYLFILDRIMIYLPDYTAYYSFRHP